MKISLAVLLLVCALGALAQEIRVRTNYFSKEDILLDDAANAYYYRIDSLADGYYGAYSYYTSNKQLRHKEAFTKSEVVKPEQWYYENGQLMMDLMCQHNSAVGKVSLWYPDGKNLAQLQFPESAEQGIASKRKVMILQYWDASGTQVVTNGEGSGDFEFPSPIAEDGSGTVVDGKKHGVWKGKVGTGTYEERYESGELRGGSSIIDGKKYEYTQMEEPAVPPGGMPAFYRFMSNHLEYPKQARKKRQEGKVFVEFMVARDGVVRDVKVIKGIGAECDAEAARVVALSPRWSPGTQRGMPVNQRMVLPLTFSLGGRKK